MSDTESAAQQPVGQPAERDCAAEMIPHLLKPNQECVFCSGSELALAVNRDWLDGKQYDEIISRHQGEYLQASGNPMTPTTLAIHFNKHMSAKGAAINKWTKSLAERTQPQTMPAVQDDDDNSMTLLKERSRLGADKTYLAELAVQEIISNLEAMKRDIAERRATGRTFDLANAMKEYGKLLQGTHSNLLKAAEVDSKLAVNESSIQSARVLEFAMMKSMNLMDRQHRNYDEFMRSAERLWFTVAVKHIVARLDLALRSTDLAPPDRAEVLSQIKSSMQGLDVIVSEEYDREVHLLRAEHDPDNIVDGVAETKEPREGSA